MRQKCRLRQCMDSVNSLKSKNSSQASSSRRRKQQTLQGVLLGSSPSRLPQYADFDDEPFEVPTDFSPRPYADHGTSNVYEQHSGNQHVAVGSKMRRGDHRLPHTHELDPLSSRPYRLSLDVAGDAMDLLDDDSDDDVMISGLPHCAGPACMSAPVPGGRYCSESCRVKHNKCGLRSAVPRISMQETAVPYNLPYPDHMYCRHHRVYSWHGNGSVAPTTPSYRAIGSSFDPRFSVDDAHMVETIRQPRGHSSFPYSTGQIHHRIPVHSTSHGSILNAPGRLGMESHGRPVLCDNSDTAAFIDSMESVIRRAVVPLELDIDLPPQHSQSTGAPMSPSPGLTNVNPYYTGRGGVDVVRTAVDLRHIDDSEDGLSHEIDDESVGDRGTPQSGTHYYYMMSYPGDATNGHTSRMNLDGSAGMTDVRLESSSIRARSVNHPLLLHDNPDAPNGVDPRYPPVRAMSIPSTSLRHSDLSASASAATQESCLGSNVPTSNILPAAGTGISSHSISTYLSGPEEFYTINDSDDLEINWPQETVAGVNA
ncbi:uncharacterized protein DEA37_0007990 [Paragonimus westermani]|uniref:Uncharacterized protein n=1 Tax=Paragonimus westermani TaxID=34504 RepID=A0A5J4NTK2_9TREM|nr:uncharacterized protein DEA37_0007990 [Paragonimus westermani]